ncbi:MAG: ABC transporter ATP-binding protein [Spirochaetes bacterium]|nr:ABC transporter ATP-binding protein [Spirochaetota bacterium]
MMRKKILIAENLTKHYPVKMSGLTFSKELVHAVNEVSFSIEEKQTLGLVGESGCGKTTTARMLLRVIEPTAGQLYFDQSEEKINTLKSHSYHTNMENNSLKKDFASQKKEIDFFSYPNNKLTKERLKMQYIFQDPYLSLNPKMQIRDIITESLIEHHLITKGQKDQTAKKYLDIVGLPQTALFKYPHEFSGGQRQRINIARAIACQPHFIICDEPVSSLDVSIQSQILNLLIDIQKELGVSYLFIAHNLAVVFYISDWIAVMYTGKIVEYGPAKKLYQKPLHPYTQLLMSVVPKIGEKKDYPSLNIRGEIPSLIDYPKGCTFYNRCPIRQKACLNSFPSLKEVEPDHQCACFLVK